MNYSRIPEFYLFGDKCVLNKPHLFSDENHLFYENVKFMFPIYKENTFHSLLALDSNNKIIKDSNSYINDIGVQSWDYEKHHTVFSRINLTYDYILNNKEEITKEEPICLFTTPFDSINFGHNLSIVFDFIYNYKNLNINVPIVISKYSLKFPNILNILKLFFDDIRIIENDKIYMFKKCYIFEPIIFDIKKHPSVINECIRLCMEQQTSSLEEYKNKTIVLIKNNTHKNVVTKENVFIIDDLHNIRDDVIFINPENMNIYDIILYLQFANCIITSFGSINYGHVIFFNNNCKLYFLRLTTSHYFFFPYFDRDKYEYINCDINLKNCKEFIKLIT